MPHIHILLILHDESKPRTPESIDKIVCAEIPDQLINPELFQVITKNNIHGPCGNVNRNCVCMVGEGADRKCSKIFPKQYINETIMTNNNYPEYRRRSRENDGRTYHVNLGTVNNPNIFSVDNSWVVPYNPLLSLKYKAHINVEIVHSTQAIKYIYKYVTKGPDRILLQINPEDEVDNFQNAMYISASEAYWRIYGFEIHHKYPAVIKLECHLPGEQIEIYPDGEEDNAVQRGPRTTMLQEYFNTNRIDETARGILYPDFPTFFTWNKSGKKWQRRIRGASNAEGEIEGSTIGRIPIITLNAHQSELFYLRMFLHYKSGAVSFKDLKTTNDDIICDTFQETCNKMGLLESDDELDNIMQEAATLRFGNHLRDMFASLLIYCRPSDTLAFWERHKLNLCQDLLQQSGLQEPNEAIYNTVLHRIQERLQLDELDLVSNFNLPAVDINLLPDNGKVPSIIRQETSYDVNVLRQRIPDRVNTLNEEQRNLYDEVVHSVRQNNGKIFAVQASGGTGKTYTMNLILDTIRSQNMIALGTAMSGIAATLLNNGRTLHSRCKIPVKITEHSTCNISPRDPTGQLLKRAKLLIIDEVGMGHKYVFEALDRTLRDLRNSNRLFGGLCILFSADWRQGLPVVPRGSRGQIVDSCLKSSYIWNSVLIHRLVANMRVMQNNDDMEFANYLIQCGDGQLQIHRQLGPYKVKVWPDLLFRGSLQGLCNWVFDGLNDNYDNPEWVCSRAIICPTNVTVDSINAKMMHLFPGEERLYKSFDSVTEDEHQYPIEFLNHLMPSGIPPHRLVLKVGAPIMLMRNLDPNKGHCNGTKYIIAQLHDRIIDAVIATGSFAGNRILIHKIPMKPSETTFPFELTRKQFPIRPCFAITANKSQGQTLGKVGVYLDKPFFGHGQKYVSESRVGDKNNLKILIAEGSYPGFDGVFTDNVVYPEILDRN